MIAIMRDGLGVGLAATQLGVLRRLLVFQAGPRQRADRAGQPRGRVALGRDRRSPRRAASACRGSRWTSSAPLYARFSGRDVEGEPVVIEASGLEARVLQHEIDHLDGVLILDRTTARAAQGGAAGAARGRQLQPLRRGRDRRASERAARAAHRRVRTAYLGTSDFAATVLRRLAGSPHRPALVVTPPDRRQGRGRKVLAAAGGRAPRASSGSSCCRPRTSTTRRRWSGSAPPSPEAVVVCAFGQLIREPLLSELPMLNVHPSLLPRWRGAAPIERAIMAGDERTGVCVMRLTEGLDSGPVALREEVRDRPRGGLRGALGAAGRARRRAAGPRPRPAGRGRARVRRAGRGRRRPTPRRSTPAERRLDPGRARRPSWPRRSAP